MAHRTPSLDRRTFLGTGALALAGLGVLILFSAAGRKQGRGGRSHAAAKKPSSAYARFTN